MTQGTVQNDTYAYDRYGNRTQTALNGGFNFSPTYSPTTNRITASGYTYDAAGNMTNDTVHSYTYDAEGNITKVDPNGATAQYVYDVFNHRIHVQTASGTTEFTFDYAGRRVSSWVSPNNVALEGRVYWGGELVSFRTSDGLTYFDHQDTLGTERWRTNYAGYEAAAYQSLPWGDGYTSTIMDGSGDQDNEHYANLERDAESGTEHAQFRNYASAQGRWLAPDPYMGSYDLTNPQSMNRYAYVLNNPMSFLDPSGLDAGQYPCAYIDGVATFCAGTGPGVPAPSGCAAQGTEGCISWPCWMIPGCGSQPSGQQPTSGGGGGSGSPPTTVPSKGIKAKVCSAIPSGRTEGVSGGLGGVGSVGGGGELVVNYNSGQVSAFGFGGVQVGWNGGVSGSIYTGFVYGLNNSNSNYSGGFTGVNGGAGVGGFAASSSGGVTGGVNGVAPTGGVTAAGVSLGGGLLSGFSGGIAVTNYTNPLQLGKFSAFSPLDALLYAARQLCN